MSGAEAERASEVRLPNEEHGAQPDEGHQYPTGHETGCGEEGTEYQATKAEYGDGSVGFWTHGRVVAHGENGLLGRLQKR